MGNHGKSTEPGYQTRLPGSSNVTFPYMSLSRRRGRAVPGLFQVAVAELEKPELWGDRAHPKGREWPGFPYVSKTHRLTYVLQCQVGVHTTTGPKTEIFNGSSTPSQFVHLVDPAVAPGT